MYTMTLTEDDLKALEFNGNRYFLGGDLLQLLASCDSVETANGTEYHIPEHKAWDINDWVLADTDGYRTSYPNIDSDSNLATQLTALTDSIV